MLKLKLYTLFFIFKNLFVPSVKENHYSGFKHKRNGYRIERVGQLPDSVLESSGLEFASDSLTFWTVGDGGCKSQLFEISLDGKVESIFPLPELRNQDWEELASDDKGNIYIGDIGNNLNKRKNLKIFKVNVREKNRIETISFNYPDQFTFPPDKHNQNFDCEAMLWHNDSLYLFSKNRGDKWMKVYCLPDKAGTYVAGLRQKIFVNAQITSADISPDHKLVSLLTYGKIYFLKVDSESDFRLKPYFRRSFNRSAQSEALVFINNTDLFLTNEQGQLFTMKKKLKKRYKNVAIICH